jgi:hypothetical protein
MLQDNNLEARRNWRASRLSPDCTPVAADEQKRGGRTALCAGRRRGEASFLATGVSLPSTKASFLATGASLPTTKGSFLAMEVRFALPKGSFVLPHEESELSLDLSDLPADEGRPPSTGGSFLSTRESLRPTKASLLATAEGLLRPVVGHPDAPYAWSC